MASLNKVFLMGNLTRDPELRYVPSGSAVTDLSIAVNRSWTGKDGERKDEVLFVDVTVWDRQAETCCQYLKKGRGVHVEGSLKMDSWDDKATGEKRSKIKVLADRVQFLDRKDDGPGGGASGGSDDHAAPTREASPRQSPAHEDRAPARGGLPPASAPRRAPVPPPVDTGEDDEDIPF